MSITIDTNRVTQVLLESGWHTVAKNSFTTLWTCDGNEYGFSFQEQIGEEHSDNRADRDDIPPRYTYIEGPLSSIAAYRKSDV